MRSIVNISLPEHLTHVVDQAVKSGKFSTKSEFFRHVLRLWIENDLQADLKKSRAELKSRKGKLLTSLKDLR